jgi:L-lactate utilization protein LutB
MRVRIQFSVLFSVFSFQFSVHSVPPHVSFYERSDRALADAALRAKVHAATGRLLSGREAGFAAFPAGEAVRDEAKRIRADVIAHLD